MEKKPFNWASAHPYAVADEITKLKKLPKHCPDCRGRGFLYRYSQLDPVFCTRCNGTGLASNPLWRGIGCVAYIAIIAFAIWVAYSVIVFEYD